MSKLNWDDVDEAIAKSSVVRERREALMLERGPRLKIEFVIATQRMRVAARRRIDRSRANYRCGKCQATGHNASSCYAVRMNAWSKDDPLTRRNTSVAPGQPKSKPPARSDSKRIEYQREYQRIWKQNNPDRLIEYAERSKEVSRRRYKEDPEFRRRILLKERRRRERNRISPSKWEQIAETIQLKQQRNR